MVRGENVPGPPANVVPVLNFNLEHVWIHILLETVLVGGGCAPSQPGCAWREISMDDQGALASAPVVHPLAYVILELADLTGVDERYHVVRSSCFE